MPILVRRLPRGAGGGTAQSRSARLPCLLTSAQRTLSLAAKIASSALDEGMTQKPNCSNCKRNRGALSIVDIAAVRALHVQIGRAHV